MLASTDIEGNKLYLKVSGHVRKQKKKTLRKTENAFNKRNKFNQLVCCTKNLLISPLYSPFHFVLWIPGLYEWVGIQINFFEIYHFFVWPGKKTRFFEKIWTLAETLRMQDLGSNFSKFSRGGQNPPPLGSDHFVILNLSVWLHKIT